MTELQLKLLREYHADGFQNSPFSDTYDWCVVDVETTGLDWTTCQLHGFTLRYGCNAEYYPVWAVPDDVASILADYRIAKVGQNFHGFDAKVLRRAGFTVNGHLDDVMVVWNLYDDRSPLGLKYLSEKHLGSESLEKKRALDRYIAEHKAGNIAGLCAQDLLDPEHPHLKVIGEYCIEDGDNTERLFFLGIQKLRELDRKIKEELKLPKSPVDYYLEEARPLERVLFDMEYAGIRVNLAEVEKVRAAAAEVMAQKETALNTFLRKRIAVCEEKLLAAALAKPGLSPGKQEKLRASPPKFQWSNNNHVGRLLYECCDLPDDLVQKTDKGTYRTDKTTLAELREHLSQLPEGQRLRRLVPLLADFAEYKKQQKIVSTYTGNSKKGIYSKIRTVDGVPRIYPRYRQTTGTGRLACSNPNMQNLKRDSDVKRFFVPDDPETEVVDDADYSQIELRTASHCAGPGPLRDAYLKNQDVHLKTASSFFKRLVTKADDVERQVGKRTNFLTIFKGSKYRLQQALLADTGKEFPLEQCEEFIEIWFKDYPEVKAYLDDQLQFFLKHRIVWGPTGRIRRIPDIVLGADIVWERGFGGRSRPKYVGPAARRASLVESILKKNPKMRRAQVTESMIGREAKLRYGHAEKVGFNQPIQGLAATLSKRSMIRLHAEGRRILNQVHDSLAVSRRRDDGGEGQRHLLHVMRTCYPLDLPVEVDCKTLRSFHPKDKA